MSFAESSCHVLQELESLKRDKCQVQQLQFELDKALETKGNLEWQLERASTFQSLIQDKIQSYEAENDSKADLIIQSMNERSQLLSEDQQHQKRKEPEENLTEEPYKFKFKKQSSKDFIPASKLVKK